MTAKDSKFSEKKSGKHGSIFNRRIYMHLINRSVLKSWINSKLLSFGIDDEIVQGLVYCYLNDTEIVNVKELQMNLSGFLESNTETFLESLWEYLVEAQESSTGIPRSVINRVVKHKDKGTEGLK